jgi:hypothetical protein
MEKGLEISFKVPDVDGEKIAEALTNLVGNEFLADDDISWRVFYITMGEEKFYKACFIGRKLSKLHPLTEEKVRKRFDEISHLEKKELMKMYNNGRKNIGFKTMKIERKFEEFDLWQDNFWQYF